MVLVLLVPNSLLLITSITLMLVTIMTPRAEQRSSAHA